MTTMRCLFRVAAGPHIGFGHLLRVRALARALGVKAVVSMRGSAMARRTAVGLGCRIEPRPLAKIEAADFDVWVVDDPSPALADRWLARARRLGVPGVAIQDV